MASPVVLMAVPMLPDLELALDSKFRLLRLWQAEDPGAMLRQHSGQIQALVVNHKFEASAAVIDALPRLEIVSSFSVGLDKIDLKKCKERGVAVTNTPDVLTDETADLAMALLLGTMRRICPADRYVREGLWPVHGDFPLSHKVSGKRIGIVGLGRIGSAIAKRAEGFSCAISYSSREKKPGVPYAHYSSLVDLARDSDALIVACALTPETRHLVSREVIDALGPEGTLVNIARGPIVDEAELVQALVDKRLGAAGLDVFEEEPQVPQELLGMDNVVLLPHVGSGTWDTRRAMGDLVVRNLEAHFSGKSLVTPVAFE
ncbi:hypothetical protein SELMODRAFT_156743 [Selaginella moellendorffii]|uniref:Uncharacterized protein n=1 Tax=Selaginella moellendorffii TaxID=88036 RepID=D8SMS4_SELML|nr:hydroxyphenylpyruvate reductase [Selaginella moellendorffii]EFJ14231.1 hypothetical protein SELMODRAFT_156743 [Selaginella moellendorffii]|eukprot:XP_002984586.1 hydroxyphenylpyruvate reductase [Selaginella moellendorffii]